MKIKLLALAFVGAFAVVSVGGTAMAAPGGNGKPENAKIQVCHQTHSEGNPEVVIWVSNRSNRGHGLLQILGHPHEHGVDVHDTECKPTEEE